MICTTLVEAAKKGGSAVAHCPPELLANRHTRSAATIRQNRRFCVDFLRNRTENPARLATLEDHPRGLKCRPASTRANELDMSWYGDTAIRLHAAFRGDDLIQCTEEMRLNTRRATVTC